MDKINSNEWKRKIDIPPSLLNEGNLSNLVKGRKSPDRVASKFTDEQVLSLRKNAESEGKLSVGEQKHYYLAFKKDVTANTILEKLKGLGLSCQKIVSEHLPNALNSTLYVVFQISEPISNTEVRESFELSLKRIFPDSSLLDEGGLTKKWEGGQLIHSDDQHRIDVESIIRWGTIFELTSKKSESSKSRFLTKECKKTLGSFINSKGIEQNFSPAQHFDWEKAKNNCRILKEYLDGTLVLTPFQLYGLASNFVLIKGGQKQFSESLKAYPSMLALGKSILSFLKKAKDSPHPIKDFSPYSEDQDIGILTDLYLRKGEVRRLIPQTKRKSIDDAEREFSKAFAGALKADDQRIYVFRVPTGFGKTEKILNKKKMLIAFPNHALRREISGRMRKKGIVHLNTPELNKGLSKPVYAKLLYLYQIGLNKEAVSFFRKVSSGEEGNVNDQRLAQDFFKESQLAIKSSSTVLTTHDRALLGGFKHDTIIFDEDPLQKILSLSKVNYADFKALANLLGQKGELELKRKVQELEFSIARHPLAIPFPITKNFFLDYEEIVELICENKQLFSSNILGYFKADFQITDLGNSASAYFLSRRDLPKDKKIIILSATADEKIYQSLYGDRVSFYDFSQIEPVGEIRQFAEKGFSQSRLRTMPDITNAKAIVEKQKVITFKKLANKFENAEKEIYFGKTTGFDTLKGQDFVVLGTPHLPQYAYALYAAALKLEVKDEEYLDFAYRKVKWKGFEFWFYTFGNKALQELQLGLIEAQLIQAVGRARTLRERCTVKLYSNLPLDIAEIVA